jgi:hypothetical protein
MSTFPPSEQLFGIGMGLAQQLAKAIPSTTPPRDAKFYCYAAMRYFFAKSYKSYQAIRLLWRAGYVEDALMLARTIFEIALQAQYASIEPSRARLFLEFHSVSRYRLCKKLQRAGAIDPPFPTGLSPTQLAELKQAHDQVACNYAKSEHWWGHGIDWLAEQCGKDMYRHYLSTYAMQSDFVHSGVVSADQYFRSDDGCTPIGCYPFPSDRLDIPWETTYFFVLIASLTTAAFGIDLEEKIREAFDALNNLSPAAHGAPPSVSAGSAP